ncbi:hypothetical protein RvY_17628 [Ramazzottius varieornatus]|uniref:BTB domain-containing protein n=1 Tax=Ramazzottius varieornatus TaxID=947166 RepID=A0A1D1W329_RAMVA|nr:hypothetical protein RvY_17628 [Ramazzottius varieornatus]
MYYGCLDIPDDQAKDVLAAADKYELLDLKEHCERLLIRCLVAKNLVHLLLFADEFSAPKLLAVASHYPVADPTKTLEMPNVDELLGSGNLNLVRTVFADMLKQATNRAPPSLGTRAILSRGEFRGRGGGVVHIGPARQPDRQSPVLGFNYPY